MKKNKRKERRKEKEVTITGRELITRAPLQLTGAYLFD